jgi:hypothetical protein
MRIPASLFLGLSGLALMACQRTPTASHLEVLSWSGQEGDCVALDQPLRVRFSAPLRAPLRPGAVLVVDEGDHPVPGLMVRIDGPYLQILPKPPQQANLSGGSLAPGQSFAIRLRGLPSLSALQGEAGEVLAGDLDLRFQCCPATDPAALLGLGDPTKPLQLLPGQLQGGLLSLRPKQELVLRFASGVDPRTLQERAVLEPAGEGESLKLVLELRDNQLEEAMVVLDLGDWSGWGILRLPEGLEGLGGQPLAPELQQLRIHR